MEENRKIKVLSKLKSNAKLIIVLALFLISSLTMLVCVNTTSKSSILKQEGVYSINGSGTQAKPYEITSASDFSYVMSAPNSSIGYCKLMNDITITSSSYSSPGCSDAAGGLVSFVLDGNYKKITVNISKEVTKNQAQSSYAWGLWGWVGSATIKNLWVTGTMNFSGYPFAVGLFGGAAGGIRIENCNIDLDITVSHSDPANHNLYVGGFVGCVGNTQSASKVSGATVVDSCLLGSINLPNYNSSKTKSSHEYGQKVNKGTYTTENSYYNIEGIRKGSSGRYSYGNYKGSDVNTACKDYANSSTNSFVAGRYDSSTKYGDRSYQFTGDATTYYASVQYLWLVNRFGFTAQRLSVSVDPSNKVSYKTGDRILYYMTGDGHNGYAHYGPYTATSYEELEVWIYNIEDYDGTSQIITYSVTSGYFYKTYSKQTSTLTIYYSNETTVEVQDAYIGSSKASTSIVSISTAAITAELKYLSATTDYDRSTNKYTLKVYTSSKEEITIVTVDARYELIGWYVGSYSNSSKNIGIRRTVSLNNYSEQVSRMVLKIYPILKLKSYTIVLPT